MNEWLNIVGLLMNIAGLWIAIHQTRKAKSAARAAELASELALAHVKTIQGVVTIQQVCWQCKELLGLLREKQLRTAATAAVNLREAISRFRVTDVANKVHPPSEWTERELAYEAIHKDIELASMTDRISQAHRLQIVHEVANLHAWLSAIAAKVEIEGVNNVHTG